MLNPTMLRPFFSWDKVIDKVIPNSQNHKIIYLFRKNNISVKILSDE